MTRLPVGVSLAYFLLGYLCEQHQFLPFSSSFAGSSSPDEMSSRSGTSSPTSANKLSLSEEERRHKSSFAGSTFFASCFFPSWMKVSLVRILIFSVKRRIFHSVFPIHLILFYFNRPPPASDCISASGEGARERAGVGGACRQKPKFHKVGVSSSFSSSSSGMFTLTTLNVASAMISGQTEREILFYRHAFFFRRSLSASESLSLSAPDLSFFRRKSFSFFCT